MGNGVEGFTLLGGLSVLRDLFEAHYGNSILFVGGGSVGVVEVESAC